MKKTFFFIILLAVLVSLGFWVGLILSKENQRELHTLGVESLATQLNHIIQQRLEMAERLAADLNIVDSLRHQQELPATRQLFNTANLVANTDLIYVLDAGGTTVASSDSPTSPLIGRNYSFRPYYQESIQGNISIFPAVGAFTEQRGLHLSVPIFYKDKTQPTGVLVLKIGISEVENLLQNQEEKIAIISPDGIIFSSNQPDWLFYTTRSISESARNRFRETRQFGGHIVEQKPFTLHTQFARIGAKPYHVARSPLMIPGWEMVSFQGTHISKPLPALYKILICSSLSVTGCLILLIFSLLNSIQRRKRMAIKLVQAEKKYRSIFENAVMGVFQSSLDGRFVEASPSMAKILGYKNPEELIHNVSDIKQTIYVSPEDRRNWLKLLNDKGQVNDFVTRFKRVDGHHIWVSLSCRLAQSLNKEGLLIEGFCLDITEKIVAQKEAELQRTQMLHAEKMISIGVLTAGVAHEINNPNTFVMSSSELLAEAWEQAAYIMDRFCEEQGENFLIAGMPYSTFRENLPAINQRIITGSQRINRIIKELLVFSRKDTKNTKELVNLNKVLCSAETLLSSTIKKSTNNFSMKLDRSCPLIRANTLLVEQVIINIMQNACQALKTPEKKMLIRTFYRQETSEVVIACEDEGVGISQEDLSLITEPFFTTKRDTAGTGLGLAISSSIMQDLGATMNFESEKNVGTTVYLSFSAAQTKT